MENKLSQNYNDIILIEKSEEERQKQPEKVATMEAKNEVVQSEEFRVEEEELEVFENYLKKKSYKECLEEASGIRELVERRLLEEEEEELMKEISNYIENKKDGRYVDFKRERQQQQQGGYGSKEESIEKISEIRSNQASILVQQPKKFTSEQKKRRILESIMKKSNSQRIKINLI